MVPLPPRRLGVRPITSQRNVSRHDERIRDFVLASGYEHDASAFTGCRIECILERRCIVRRSIAHGAVIHDVIVHDCDIVCRISGFHYGRIAFVLDRLLLGVVTEAIYASGPPPPGVIRKSEPFVRFANLASFRIKVYFFH
jgi:hypothetical protein